MISYEPLLQTMREQGVTKNDLRKAGILNPKSIAKFEKGESLKLSTINKICEYLRVPIERVVRIDF